MDTADVFYVGGIGNTSFSINNITYQIAPGDIMYIPRSVNHTPQPQAARAGFSIGLEHGRHDTSYCLCIFNRHIFLTRLYNRQRSRYTYRC